MFREYNALWRHLGMHKVRSDMLQSFRYFEIAIETMPIQKIEIQTVWLKKNWQEFPARIVMLHLLLTRCNSYFVHNLSAYVLSLSFFVFQIKHR